MKLLYFILIFFGFLIYSFFNLGNFLDVTEEPSKTDLLVCLGGGDYQTRVEKTLEIYNKNISTTSTIILTSYVNDLNDIKQNIIEDKRITYLKENNPQNDIDIIFAENLKNTAEEVKFIKIYMIENNLKDVTFISETPHSRRILLFTKLIHVDKDEKLSFKVIGADVGKWQNKDYYLDKYSLSYSLTEVTKIIYGIFLYGILEGIGLNQYFENFFFDYINNAKKLIQKNINLL